ncbi:IclR family transcriptional regulator [Pseudonocardia kujensis]|uniref:IclR family transcriptional regulator n=1 Tax=Pseudonocardia kujensis TaxID=1128675 RepID=UPI001E61F0A0|nr:IclR family transcriptional regulator [Pseudonocardia kujensis]MCE0765572.1 IclR family transcriptional regulator [Pseudonocardia kujensis]
MAEGDGESSKESSGRLGALRHGLAVFDMFDVDRQTVTVAEIARHLGLHKSTASRIASNLVLSGYLLPASSGSGYRLSGKLTRLGAIAAADTNLTTVSMEHMQALVEDTGETCHVGVLEGHEAVTVALVDGSYSVRLHSWVGKRSDAHSTAMGKTLLAGLSDATIDMLYPKKTLPQPTAHTLGTVADLKEQLSKVREHGFALDNEELEPGLRCVAAPITDHDRRVVAALTIAGASSRLTMARIDEYVAKVKASARRISTALGAPDDDFRITESAG